MSSVNQYRKCSKCFEYRNCKLFHRFPKPGKTNVLRARAWATFCWPEKDWSSVEDLTRLYRNNKMLCKKHFEDTCFIDTAKKRLSRFSVPGSRDYVLRLMETLRKQRDEQIDKNIPLQSLKPIPSTSKEPEDPPEPIFSWQKEDAVVDSDTEEGEEDADWQNEDSFMYGVDVAKDVAPDEKDDIDQDYRCNLCIGSISGCRYTCVQCCDYDLCAACEKGGAHAHHYMLRVPDGRPYSEVQCVLKTIRRILLTDDVIQVDADDELKTEVKEEDADPTPVDHPEWDPLVVNTEDDQQPTQMETEGGESPRSESKKGDKCQKTSESEVGDESQGRSESEGDYEEEWLLSSLESDGTSESSDQPEATRERRTKPESRSPRLSGTSKLDRSRPEKYGNSTRGHAITPINALDHTRPDKYGTNLARILKTSSISGYAIVPVNKLVRLRPGKYGTNLTRTVETSSISRNATTPFDKSSPKFKDVRITQVKDNLAKRTSIPSTKVVKPTREVSLDLSISMPGGSVTTTNNMCVQQPAKENVSTKRKIDKTTIAVIKEASTCNVKKRLVAVDSSQTTRHKKRNRIIQLKTMKT